MPVTALVVPVSGPYTGTWNAHAMGTQNDDGFVLRGTYQGQEVNATDAYGMTLVEAIYRGINWRLQFRSMEFNKPAILEIIQTFGETGDPTLVLTPILSTVATRSPIGDRFSKFAESLVLTSTLGAYPPTMPSTLTALGAVIAPQSNIEFMMTSKVREVPFEMVLLPYTAVVASTSYNVSFTTT